MYYYTIGSREHTLKVKCEEKIEVGTALNVDGIDYVVTAHVVLQIWQAMTGSECVLYNGYHLIVPSEEQEKAAAEPDASSDDGEPKVIAAL